VLRSAKKNARNEMFPDNRSIWEIRNARTDKNECGEFKESVLSYSNANLHQKTWCFQDFQSCACNVMLEAEGRVTHSVCVCAHFQNI
jgi:hypothetical protein